MSFVSLGVVKHNSKYCQISQLIINLDSENLKQSLWDVDNLQIIISYQSFASGFKPVPISDATQN